jgi:O-antigen/teichoic acid export membrane protein
LVLGQQLSRVLSVILLPFLTPYLTKLDFGVWGLVLTYTGLLAGIKDFGLTQLIVNVFFKRTNRYSVIWKVYFGWLLLWSILFVILQALILWFSLYYVAFEDRIQIIAIFSIVGLVTDPYILFVFRYNQLSNRFNVIALNSLITGSLSIFVAYYLIAKLKMGYMGWVWSFFIAQLTSFVHYYIVAVKNKMQLRPVFCYRQGLFKEAIKVGWPTIPHNYSSYILNASDRVVMDKMKVPINDIGVYNLGYSIGLIGDSIGSAVTMILSPIYLKLFTQKEYKVIKQMTFCLQFIFLFFTLLIGIWIKELFPILIRNESLQVAYKVTFVIIISYSFRPLYIMPVNLLGFTGRTSALWKITSVGAIVNVVLNIIFIPIYGYFAAAVVTFLSLFLIAFIGYRLRSFKEVFPEDFRILSWAVLIFTLSGLAYIVIESNMWVKIIATVSLMVLLVKNFLKLNNLNRNYNLF